MKDYTEVAMAALDFIQAADEKSPEDSIRKAIRKLTEELIKADLLKMPYKDK
jgi:hypothetical protein